MPSRRDRLVPPLELSPVGGRGGEGAGGWGAGDGDGRGVHPAGLRLAVGPGAAPALAGLRPALRTLGLPSTSATPRGRQGRDGAERPPALWAVSCQAVQAQEAGVCASVRLPVSSSLPLRPRVCSPGAPLPCSSMGSLAQAPTVRDLTCSLGGLRGVPAFPAAVTTWAHTCPHPPLRGQPTAHCLKSHREPLTSQRPGLWRGGDRLPDAGASCVQAKPQGGGGPVAWGSLPGSHSGW